MTKFTDNNTDGLSQHDLDTLNEAYERIMQHVDTEFEDDTHAVSDALCNAHSAGMTADELFALVAPLFA